MPALPEFLWCSFHHELLLLVLPWPPSSLMAPKSRFPFLSFPQISRFIYLTTYCCCCCSVASVVSDSVRPHRRQPTRFLCPWDSPGKNSGVGCHFLQGMNVKSESEVAQSCDPMDCSLPGSLVLLLPISHLNVGLRI